MEVNITNENFESLKNGDMPLVVDFWATWCGPYHHVLQERTARRQVRRRHHKGQSAAEVRCPALIPSFQHSLNKKVLLGWAALSYYALS